MEDEPQAFSTVSGDWRSICDLFDANAERFPDRIAVETAQGSRTYAELAARIVLFADRIAARLSGDNRLVGVCLDRDLDLPAWLFAVLRVGCAYLSLDPSLPPARIGHVLEDAAPGLIVASRSLLGALPPSDVPVLIADDEADAPSTAGVAIRPDTLAYVIYTSGSTGRPKGVEIEHGALAALMATMAVVPGLAQGERMMALTRISFDLSVPDMFLPFAVGGTLAVVPLDRVADPERLADAFTRHRPDLVQGTPSLWRALLESGWTGRAGLRLVAGGEAMTRDLADRLGSCCAELWNFYGPTEATVWSTAYRVEPGTGPVSIGTPLDGVWVEIADADLRLLPAGETGEIVIGGCGVARGYRNRAELTAERFVDLADGRRVYRTGDLGRFDAQGALFCLGRSDDQVKVRGFRIELGDIEAALARVAGVAWCAARVCEDAAGEPRLVGYVVPRVPEAVQASDVKATLAREIPPYMVPDRIEIVAVMPLTPNGKIDRAALANPFPTGAAVPATTDDGTISGRLAVIWCDLLGVERVDPADDFFDLGGYSLITVRLTRRIHDTFGVKLSLTDLLRDSTLAAMAARIVAGSGGEQTAMLLNAGGQRPPLYWLDAGPLMRTVMRALPDGQPALALNLSSADEASLDAGTLTIAAVAKRLRDQLVTIQPHGPYHIGGWCRWGIVAFELAVQLRREGHDVALLVLLDADRPRAGPREGVGLRRWLSGLLSAARRTSEPASLSERVRLAGQRYRAGPYDGDVLLIRPSTTIGDGGWRRLLGARLTIAVTDGDHESMVRLPHARDVAAAIATALARTGATPAPADMPIPRQRQFT